MSPNKIIDCIKKNKSFLVTSHLNLEGDAIGSQLALARLLEMLDKKVFIVDSEPFPNLYKFLPDYKKILFEPKKKIKADCAIVLDCTDLKRIGSANKLLTDTKFIVNIDHHVSNEQFGDINWVEPYASSTGEMVYEIFKKFNLKVDKKSSIYIYVAILTDTGSFKYSNATSYTHKIVSELMHIGGISPYKIYKKIYEESPLSNIRLLGLVLSTLKVNKGGKIAWLKITQGMLKQAQAKVEGTEDFVNFPRSIKDVEVAAAFRQMEDGRIKVSFRSNGTTDVNRLAKLFGGGGHITASGCILKGSMKKVEEKVINKIKYFLEK